MTKVIFTALIVVFSMSGWAGDMSLLCETQNGDPVGDDSFSDFEGGTAKVKLDLENKSYLVTVKEQPVMKDGELYDNQYAFTITDLSQTGDKTITDDEMIVVEWATPVAITEDVSCMVLD